MADTEIGVISHLLEVEAEASELVKNAQAEANKRLSEARAKADSDFKLQFEKIQSKFESEYNTKIQSISENHAKIIKEYKESAESVEQDKESFKAFLEKVLSED